MTTRRQKHGLKGTPEYDTWVRIRQRCRNRNSPDYMYYGARGIRVCDQWESPVRFVKDMGARPSPDHEIDRIDNNGDYTPTNCRWVLKVPQMRNTRLSKRWFVDGVRYESLSHAASIHDTTPSRIKAWCEGRSDGGYVYLPRVNCWSEKAYE